MKKSLCFLLALALCLSLGAVLPTATSAAETLTGDVNGDSAVNDDDLELLTHYLNGWPSTTIYLPTADIDGNGKVENRDRVLLARYLAGWTGYDVYFTPPEPLTIVKEPEDMEMHAQSAVLSITVSGVFDYIVYDWQKLTSEGWRDVATLNNEDATYTVNNAALQIVSKNGTEGFGEYRCTVSAFNGGELVDQVTSRTATVDPEAEPMKASLGEPKIVSIQYFYYYHTSTNTQTVTDPVTGEKSRDETAAWILKNYMTEERFQYMITPLQLIPDEVGPHDENGDPLYFEGSVDGFYDATQVDRLSFPKEIYKDENGDWWIIPASRVNCVKCPIGNVSGGKGPYTYSWYFSKDRFGNDYQPLIEGYNCLGQGTEEIIVWPFVTGKGKDEPYFMGFLCCKVTDSKGRTTNATYWLSGMVGKTHGHAYIMLYALDEDSHWFDSPNYDGGGNSKWWWWTAPRNAGGVGGWW